MKKTMKKSIASLAIASMMTASAMAASSDYTGDSVKDISITGTFGFESEYVFRGKKRAQQSFQPSVELGFPVLGGDLYAGAWTNLPVNSQETITPSTSMVPYGNNTKEIDLYIGYAYTVDDLVTLDVGYTYYWYPATTSVAATGMVVPGETIPTSLINSTNEVFIGASFDVLLSPSIYYYYDFSLRQSVIEGSIGYSFDLSQMADLEGFSFDLGGYLGYLTADKYAGDNSNSGSWSNGYTYLGATGDLVYNFNENVSMSTGVRWSLNNDGTSADKGGNSFSMGPEQNLWFGASLGFAY